MNDSPDLLKCFHDYVEVEMMKMAIQEQFLHKLLGGLKPTKETIPDGKPIYWKRYTEVQR